tara:strand:+ start:2754 stop:3722 length:969 start_codon:yes stop_codon:yes gene_type:complete
MNIAVYSPNWVGDAALALPFISHLKNKNPDSKVILVCKDWVESVFHNNPNIDNVVSLSANQTRGAINTIKTGLILREKQIDYFYTLTDSFRSAVIMWLSNSRYRIGYNTQNRSILLTKYLDLPGTTVHRSKKYLGLINRSEVNLDERYINLDDDQIKWAKERMHRKNINNPVALFPFSVAKSRTFPKKKINEWLSESSEHFVIFGAESDRKNAEEIIQQNKNIKITSFCGDYELRKSIALISSCKYAIAADSGLGHISSIIGIPTISFFGAGRSIETRPIGRRNIIIDKSELCNPCKKNICCLNSIKKSDVNYAIESLHLDS